jgi:tRNA threonylcarbamoyladenosine biosynthesis protein TsaB
MDHMLILAIDTSGRHGSVALCRGDAESCQTLQLMPIEGGTYSAALVPVITSLLQQNGIGKGEIEGFAVVSGPGSFTGLRVGLATVKGLCEILQKPLSTISMLEAVAATYGRAGDTVTAVLDAGRSEVYAGDYAGFAGGAEAIREYITKLAAFNAEPGRELLTPDAAVAESLRLAGKQVRLVAPLQAGTIGRIGIRKLLAGELADPVTVDVNYIRRSDAEILFVSKS